MGHFLYLVTKLISRIKLMQTEMQRGWKWNEKRMDWVTNEDFIDTKRVINPKASFILDGLNIVT